MKKYLTLLAMMMLPMTILAQEATDSLFKGKFKNAELNIQCQLNLYDEAIEVPGLELEMCYGFLQGQGCLGERFRCTGPQTESHCRKP